MKKPIFITGNQSKADYLAQFLGIKLEHQKVDLEEIQSLDVREVAKDKARRAYEMIKKPVLVEDVSVEFEAFGKLPGTFIKWFLAELTNEQICRLLDNKKSRKATARICFCYFDDNGPKFFEGSMRGEIADHPRGKNGFGWDFFFIKDGMTETRAELDLIRQEETSMRHTVHEKLRDFLNN